MSKRSRIITLVTLSILIFLCSVLGITYAFMRNSIDNNSFTEISLSSCATITLSDENSINLSNSYPMSRNKALQTTPYTFTVSGLCEGGVLFNVYVASLANNTLDANNIHYIITNNGSKEPLIEGILGNATDGINDFNDSELKQISTGINGEYGNIYNLYTDSIHFDMEKKYDLYLYIDESVTNETMGQTFSAGLAVKASDYDFATVDEVTVTETTTDSITVSVTATAGTNTIQNYYYSINNGEYVSSTSNTYTFERLEMGTEYNIKVYVTDTNGVQSNVYNLSVQTDDTPPTLADTCRETGSNTLACHVATQYTTDGENGLYYHTSSLANSAGDNSYRYSGANPNNYVCFGSDASTCPSDNLYRIIGVFGDNVKLIKSTSYGSYAWDSGENNTWDSSTKPSIRTTLNTTFLGTISTTWQNKIATHAYKVGGMSNSTTNTAKQYYNTEVGSSSSSTTDRMKIGLMYVSDYGFAASPDYWTTELYSYQLSKSSNWLAGLTEWTISRWSDNTYLAFRVLSIGFVDGDNFVYGTGAVRPVFYLEPDVKFSGGSGTSSDPYRLSI